MAHKKGVGSSKNGRESQSKRLGVKIFGGDCSNTKSSIAFDRKIFLCVQSVFFAPDLAF